MSTSPPIFALSLADLEAPPEFVHHNCSDCLQEADYLICFRSGSARLQELDPRTLEERRFLDEVHAQLGTNCDVGYCQAHLGKWGTWSKRLEPIRIASGTGLVYRLKQRAYSRPEPE